MQLGNRKIFKFILKTLWSLWNGLEYDPVPDYWEYDNGPALSMRNRISPAEWLSVSLKELSPPS